MLGFALAPDEHMILEAEVSNIAYISAFVLFLALMVTGQLSGLFTTSLALTSKRVIGTRGLIMRRKIDVPHARISGVRVWRGLFGKIFDYGTVRILTTDGTKYTFRGITMPYYVGQQIEEAAEIAVLGHRLSEYVGDTDKI